MEDLRDTWASFRRDGNVDARNKLCEHYLPLVRYQAQQVAAKLPAVVELDDLVAAGCFGLMEALASFDPERAVKFSTFSARRIRGAILDHLRATDWAPRLVRTRTQRLNQARDALQKQFGRAPTDHELAAKMDLSRKEYDRVRGDSQPVKVASIDRVRHTTESDRDVREIDMLRDQKQPDPLSEAVRRDLKQIITCKLSRAEQLIVVLYYYEGMTMREIGETLDLSESRVSQMHTSIMARLRAWVPSRIKERDLAVA